MSLQSFINRTLNEQQIQYKRVLNPENKSELKNHTYNEDAENLNNKCPIIMRTFKNKDVITNLPCNHLFDSAAIEEWVLNSKATCPVCRYQLKNTKEVRITPLTQNNDISNNDISNNDLSNNESSLRSFMNYIINGSLNEIINEIPQPNIFNDDFPNNPIQNDISDNLFGTSENPIQNDPVLNDPVLNDPVLNDPVLNDPVLNSMNRYLSTINNIINRQIEQEDNHIMQEVILASLREQ
jgi:hypothetical protein